MLERRHCTAAESRKNVLIAAHGNSLRALVKMLDEVSDKEITDFNIPTGIPLAYELDDDLKPVVAGIPRRRRCDRESRRRGGRARQGGLAR